MSQPWYAETKQFNKKRKTPPATTTGVREQHHDDDDDDDDEGEAKQHTKGSSVTSPRVIVHRVAPERLVAALGKWNSARMGPEPDKHSCSLRKYHTPDSILIIDVRGNDRNQWGFIAEAVNFPIQFVTPHSVRALCAAASELGKTAVVFHCLHSKHRAVYTAQMMARLAQQQQQQSASLVVTAGGSSLSSSSSSVMYTAYGKQSRETMEPWLSVSKWKERLSSLAKSAAKDDDDDDGGATATRNASVAAPTAPSWPAVYLLEGGFRVWLQRWLVPVPELCCGVPATRMKLGAGRPFPDSVQESHQKNRQLQKAKAAAATAKAAEGA